MDNLFQKLMLGGSTAALFAAMPVAAFAQDSVRHRAGGGFRLAHSDRRLSAADAGLGGWRCPAAGSRERRYRRHAAPNALDGRRPDPRKRRQRQCRQLAAPWASATSICAIWAPPETWSCSTASASSRPILSGGVDLTVIPSTMVQRVDVVTGGASAAWGSDAVSGVVNLIINKNFTGLKASIDLQDTGQDTRRSYGFTVTNGFDMLGGRSHVEWAVTYNDSPETVFMTSAHWFNTPALVANPLYNAKTNPNVPQLIHVNNAGDRDVPGGDLQANTGAAAALNGIQFGPGGLLAQLLAGRLQLLRQFQLFPRISPPPPPPTMPTAMAARPTSRPPRRRSA